MILAHGFARSSARRLRHIRRRNGCARSIPNEVCRLSRHARRSSKGAMPEIPPENGSRQWRISAGDSQVDCPFGIQLISVWHDDTATRTQPRGAPAMIRKPKRAALYLRVSREHESRRKSATDEGKRRDAERLKKPGATPMNQRQSDRMHLRCNISRMPRDAYTRATAHPRRGDGPWRN